MADPVAEKSGFLKMYMSSHPDTLVAYAKWFGKVKETIKSAEMSYIDTKAMTLTCTLTDGSKKEVKVPIEPPLKGYDDVKPRLLEMKALAQEGLGMIKVPKIDKFYFPRNAKISAAVIGTIFYLHVFKGLPTPLSVPADFVAAYGGPTYITLLSMVYWPTLVVHILESAYASTLCYRHSTGFFLGFLYVVGTFFAGFPVWSKLKKEVQKARIDSVMKIQ